MGSMTRRDVANLLYAVSQLRESGGKDNLF